MANPLSQFYSFPSDLSVGNLDKEALCVICCGRAKLFDIRHVHISSQYYIKQAILSGNTSPFCYNCQLSHHHDRMTRCKLILTSSALFGVPHLREWTAADIHVDWECIAGATLDTLKKCRERAYVKYEMPVDTMLVGGANDIKPIVQSITDLRVASLNEQLKNTDVVHKAADIFVGKLHNMYQMIKEQDQDNTLTVSRLMITPAYCWYEEEEGDFPTKDYINYRPVVEEINSRIDLFNVEIGSSKAPKLHLTGRRSISKGKKTTYHFNRFREHDKAEKHHFVDTVRVDMSKRFLKYLRICTPEAMNYFE